MKQKLFPIISPWRRLAITTLMTALTFLDRFISPRARIHWVGSHLRRRRFERHVIILLFVCAMIFLEPREIALWSAIWGGLAAFSFIFYMLFWFIPRKRAHWIRS